MLASLAASFTASRALGCSNAAPEVESDRASRHNPPVTSEEANVGSNTVGAPLPPRPALLPSSATAVQPSSAKFEEEVEAAKIEVEDASGGATDELEGAVAKEALARAVAHRRREERARAESALCATMTEAEGACGMGSVEPRVRLDGMHLRRARRAGQPHTKARCFSQGGARAHAASLPHHISTTRALTATPDNSPLINDLGGALQPPDASTTTAEWSSSCAKDPNG